jgi:glycosyltransferase involved in cell wall biosynthesis
LAVISVVIPAFNEQERLPATLEAVLAHLERGGWSGFEILVVDDGSTDATRAIAEEFGASHPEVHVLANPGNRGKGYSVRHGMLRAEGDWVLFTDADLSAPIAELEKLLRAARERGADVAIGSRALDRSLIGVHQSWFREQAGRVFNLMVRLVVGLPFWDTQCGFKLFSARAAREVFRRVRLEGFGFDVEALFIARKLGFRVVEVPVRWDHVEGTKVHLWRDSVRMFLDLLRVRLNQLRGLYR